MRTPVDVNKSDIPKNNNSKRVGSPRLWPKVAVAVVGMRLIIFVGYGRLQRQRCSFVTLYEARQALPRHFPRAHYQLQVVSIPFLAYKIADSVAVKCTIALFVGQGTAWLTSEKPPDDPRRPAYPSMWILITK